MNIVVITSICYTSNNPYTYTRTRSAFTPQERYEQLKHTIRVAREKIPEAIITVVECSPFTLEETGFLETVCDEFINLMDDKDVVADTKSVYKGLGERIMTIRALNYLTKKYKNIKNIFKISGRYYYNHLFRRDDYQDEHLNFFKIHGNINNISTCGYKLTTHNNCLGKYIKYLESTRDDVVNIYRGSYEQYITRFVHQNIQDVVFLTDLGISGLVGVDGAKYEK